MVGLNVELATFWTEDAKRDDCKAGSLLNVLIVDSHNHFDHYMFDAALSHCTADQYLCSELTEKACEDPSATVPCQRMRHVLVITPHDFWHQAMFESSDLRHGYHACEPHPARRSP